MQIAKLFWSGRSQAVRLPKEFRFDGNRVQVRRHGSAVILEAIPEDWSWLDEVRGQFDEDALKAALEQPKMQEREGLSDLFLE